MALARRCRMQSIGEEPGIRLTKNVATVDETGVLVEVAAMRIYADRHNGTQPQHSNNDRPRSQHEGGW